MFKLLNVLFFCLQKVNTLIQSHQVTKVAKVTIILSSGRNLEFTDEKKRDEWISSELKSYGSNLSEKELQQKTVEKEVI